MLVFITHRTKYTCTYWVTGIDLSLIHICATLGQFLSAVAALYFVQMVGYVTESEKFSTSLRVTDFFFITTVNSNTDADIVRFDIKKKIVTLYAPMQAHTSRRSICLYIACDGCKR